MRRLLSGLTFALAVAFGPGAAVTATPVVLAAAAEQPRPEAFVERLCNRVLEELGREAPQAERARAFRALIDEYLAMSTISQFVLGRYWSETAPAQREAFQSAFKTLLVNRFLPAFEGRSETRIQVGDSEKVSERLWAVRVVARQPGGAPMPLTLRLVARDDGLGVADVIMKGISLALTLRQEYTAFLERHDGDIAALVAEIDRRAQDLAG